MTISFRTIVRGSLAVFGMAALAGQSANAATVTTIFSTGVVANDPITGQATSFVGDGALDTHYTVATVGAATATTTPSIAAGGFVQTFAFSNTTFPVGTNYGAPTASKFVGPAGALNQPGLTNYDFRTTFSLAGFDAATATLTGTVAADNQTVGIFLNGVAVPFTPNFTLALGRPQGFTIAPGNFRSDADNVLDFIVFNDFGTSGNVLAFDANALALTADRPTLVPEPGSVAMLIGMGVTGAGFLSRRKRAVK